MHTIRLFEHEIECVVFDIDGVLLDLYARLWEYYEDIATSFDLPFASVVECRGRQERGEQEIPLTLRTGLVGVWGQLSEDQPLLMKIVDYFLALEISKPYPEVPGSRYLVRRLYKRDIKLGVCTTNRLAGADRKLKSVDIAPSWFVAKHTGDMEPRKPAPGALLSLCEEVGVHPSQTLYVGDTQGDARMAIEAGLHFVGVLSGKLPPFEFIRCGVEKRCILNTVADVPFVW
jgi:phosphoglycolate phosphatase